MSFYRSRIRSTAIREHHHLSPLIHSFRRFTVLPSDILVEWYFINFIIFQHYLRSGSSAPIQRSVASKTPSIIPHRSFIATPSSRVAKLFAVLRSWAPLSTSASPPRFHHLHAIAESSRARNIALISWLMDTLDTSLDIYCASFIHLSLS